MDVTFMFNGKELVCPRGRAGESPIVINMERIIQAEQRLFEVQNANPANAAEQLAFWSDSWRRAHELGVMVNHQKSIAEREADKVRGRIILDEVPEILKAKGLASARSPAGSEDLRTAILATNKEYQQAMERVDYLTAVAEWIKGKARSFEKAYFDVKDMRRMAATLPYKSYSSSEDNENNE